MLAQVLRDVPELAGSLRGVDALLRLRGEPVWLMLPCRVCGAVTFPFSREQLRTGALADARG